MSGTAWLCVLVALVALALIVMAGRLVAIGNELQDIHDLLDGAQ